MAPSPFPTSRFQFERTKPLRAWVYREARLSLRRRILDVGAGEGPVAEEMASRTGRSVAALDLCTAAPRPGVVPLRADARTLPFLAGSLGAVAYHFALLWFRDPVAALCEARRVLAPGGVILILSEPDLTRRVEEPDTGLGRLLVEAVRRGGGDPAAGGRVEAWLQSAGFRPHLAETSPESVEVEGSVELSHECDFLGHLEIDASGVRRRIGEVRAGGGTVRVTLPITYGWASAG